MTDLSALSGRDWMRLLLGLLWVALWAFTPPVAGFVLMKRGRSGVLFAVGLVWAVLILAISLPSIVPARPFAQRNSCIAYLKQIDAAKAQWASEAKPDSSTTPQLASLAPFLKGSVLPVCPAGGTYTLGTVNEPPRCSHADKSHTLTPPR